MENIYNTDENKYISQDTQRKLVISCFSLEHLRKFKHKYPRVKNEFNESIKTISGKVLELIDKEVKFNFEDYPVLVLPLNPKDIAKKTNLKLQEKTKSSGRQL